MVHQLLVQRLNLILIKSAGELDSENVIAVFYLNKIVRDKEIIEVWLGSIVKCCFRQEFRRCGYCLRMNNQIA